MQGATREVLCDKLHGATCSVELCDKSPAVQGARCKVQGARCCVISCEVLCDKLCGATCREALCDKLRSYAVRSNEGTL